VTLKGKFFQSCQWYTEQFDCIIFCDRVLL